MKEILLLTVAYIFIWAAAGLKRNAESKINMFSKDWFLQFALILTGLAIARYAYGLHF